MYACTLLIYIENVFEIEIQFCLLPFIRKYTYTFFYRCLLCYNIKIIISSRLFAFSTFQSSNKFRTNFLFIFFMWSVSDICFFLRSFLQYHVYMRFGTHVYLYKCTLRLILHIHLTRIGFILTCFFSPIIFLSLFFFISFLWGPFIYDVLDQG